MKRAYYDDSIAKFLRKIEEQVVGALVLCSEFADLQTQKNAWVSQIKILKENLTAYTGSIYFEFSIPRMEQRIDVVLI